MNAGKAPSASIGGPATKPLDNVRTILATIWLIGTFGIALIIILQSLLGKYDGVVQDVWSWFLPTVMPTLSMIITVLAYTAMDHTYQKAIVRTDFYKVAVSLSGAYLFVVALTILIQPFTKYSPLELMTISNLWLGPMQSLVAACLGILFVSRKKQNS